jgi:hypothetical protein
MLCEASQLLSVHILIIVAQFPATLVDGAHYHGVLSSRNEEVNLENVVPT